MNKITLNEEIWRPNRDSTIPLFKQIYDYIVACISSGKWSIGSKLPTQIEMARVFDVNRSTILEVYDELKSEGFVESRKSAGTIIINNTWSLLTLNAPTDWNKRISKSLHKPNLDIIQIINDVESKKDYIRLGAGELGREIAPTKYLKPIFNRIAEEIAYMGYDEPKGLLPLRKEIVKYLSKRGIVTDASKVLIVSGGLQALNLISMGLLNRNATILTEKPSYLKSLTLFDSHNIRLLGVDIDKNGMKIDALIKKTVEKKPDLLYTIPNFQNPTGTLMTEERREELLSICERERLAIIEDDVYGELWYDAKPPNPIKSIDHNGTVLYIGSISKTLSAGLRIGWIVANENVIERLSDIKMQTDYGSSNISQWVCYEFLRSGAYNTFIEELRKTLKDKRDYTLKLLEQHFSSLATWNKPTGGIYIWLTINKKFSPYKLFEACYKHKIVINTGNLYDDTNNNSIRISFAYASKEDLKTGLNQLSKIIRIL